MECSSCGQDLASNASACPHCGQVFTSRAAWLGVVLVLITLVIIVHGFMSRA